jgi:Right handed beta helix region
MYYKRPMTLAISMVVSLVSLGALSLPARAETEIDSCRTITEPGAYRVNRNLSAVGIGSSCLIVNASFVTLDLGGHVLTGTPGGIGIKLISNGFVPGITHSGTEVRNGTIINFGIGIQTLQSDSIIERVRVLKNFSEGISIAGGAKGVVVRQSISSENNDGIIAVSGNTFQQNVIRKNKRFGIGFITCPSLLVNNSAIENPGGNFNFSTSSSAGCVQSGNVAPIVSN